MLDPWELPGRFIIQNANGEPLMIIARWNKSTRDIKRVPCMPKSINYGIIELATCFLFQIYKIKPSMKSFSFRYLWAFNPRDSDANIYQLVVDQGLWIIFYKGECISICFHGRTKFNRQLNFMTSIITVNQYDLLSKLLQGHQAGFGKDRSCPD